MRYLRALGLLVFVFVTLITMGRKAIADTGAEGATRKEMGSWWDFRRVDIGSTTAVRLFPVDTKRPDGECKNITGSCEIWLGSTTVQINGATHSNITLGHPVFSTGSVRLEGSNTGELWATAGIGCSTQTFSCIDAKVR